MHEDKRHTFFFFFFNVDLLFTFPITLHKFLVKHIAVNGVLDASLGIYVIKYRECPKYCIGETVRVFVKIVKRTQCDVRYTLESKACFIHVYYEGHHLNLNNAKFILKSK